MKLGAKFPDHKDKGLCIAGIDNFLCTYIIMLVVLDNQKHG